MFRVLCAHHQEVKIVLYSIWYHHTCRWPSRAQVERSLWTCAPKGHLRVSGIITPVGGLPVHRLREVSEPVHRKATYEYRCDDTRCCI